MLKSKNGVTLLALVLTVVIILILAGIGTYSGMSSLTKSEDSRLSSELLMVQHAILEAYTKYIVTNKVVQNENALAGEILTGNESYIEKSDGKYYFKYDGENKIELKDSNISNYYLISTEDEFQKLGMTNTTDNYVVNYKTGEVMNVRLLKNSRGEALYVSNN